MKLEVGMYVRTENGIIGRIYEKIEDMFTYRDNNRDYITYGGLHNEILKASHNIIDLIEAGDYVNGSKVMNIVEEDGTKYLVLERDEVYYDSCLEPSSDNDIKSIVTKEMFESMQYKVD